MPYSLDELLTHCLTEDLTNAYVRIVKPLHELTEDYQDRHSPDNPSSYPETIGLLGHWGAGKSTGLALYADDIRQTDDFENNFNLIYFNAWAASGGSSVSDALAYELIKANPPEEDSKEVAIKICKLLWTKYGKDFGHWTKEKVGIDAAEIITDLASIKDIKNTSSISHDQWESVLDVVMNRSVQIKRYLEQYLSSCTKTQIVLIDELDRCDPGEVIETLRALKTLFMLNGCSVLFILAINPDPIGHAIKHLYGLKDLKDEYESNRIIEKYVDHTVNMVTPSFNDDFIRDILAEKERLDPKIKWPSFIDLEMRSNWKERNELYYHDSETYRLPLKFFTCTNLRLNNLRMLKKNLNQTFNTAYHNEGFLWNAWLLSVIKETDPELRLWIAQATDALKAITQNAYCHMFNQIVKLNYLNGNKINVGSIHKKINEQHTMFSMYYSDFYENIGYLAESGSITGAEIFKPQRDLLDRYQSDPDIIHIIMLICMLPFDFETLELHTGGQAAELSRSIKNYDPMMMNQFGWLLANS